MWTRLRSFLTALTRREQFEDTLSEELRFHLDAYADDLIGRGLSRTEAYRRARVHFGSVERVRDECRQARGLRFLDDIRSDLRFGLRGLARNPGFTAAAALTLALGIGATTAIFAVVNGVILKPLPFEDQDELVGVWNRTTRLLSSAQYFTYRDGNRVFEDVGSFAPYPKMSVTGLAEPEQVDTTGLTASLLPLLRVQPVIGRRFTAADDSPGAPQTIMLSHAYWQRRFGADPRVLGSILRVDGIQREIIGVLPPAFMLPLVEAAIYYPLKLNRAEASRGSNYVVIARLLPGATIQQASADVERMIPMVAEQFPGGITPARREQIQRGAVHPLKQDFIGDIGNVLWVLLGTVGIVLLIACANVANLFLVRAEGRQREVAVRTALGAARGQIARQFLLESMVLGLLGGLAGVGLAFEGVRLLTWMRPDTLPRLNEIALDPRVLAFTLGISILSGLSFGLFPVLRVGGLDLVSSLKEGGRGGSTGTERHRARHTLVVAQVALALVLLAGSGLMIRSFQALRNVDPGFANAEEVLTFQVANAAAEIEDEAEMALAYEDMWGRLQAVPGVTSVGASSSLTMVCCGPYAPVYFEDFPLLPEDRPPFWRYKYVTEDYFETMQNAVLAGRAIEWSDIRGRASVVVITRNVAEDYWGSPAAALGKRVARAAGPNPTWLEIVGVVGNVHDAGVSQPAPPLIFRPVTQHRLVSGVSVWLPMTFAVRTSRLTASSLRVEVRAAIEAVNPNLPPYTVRTLDDILAQSMARTSFLLVMLAISAAVALVLGVVGIYGVISYVVSQRTREIGVRMALGADGRDVRRMVLRQGMILAGVGVLVGLVAAIGLTRLMSSLLYGVEATDPATFAAVAAMLTAVALGASYLPALRASRTDPLEALRFE